MSVRELSVAEREFVEAADWLVRCLREVIQQRPVRGLPEAKCAYYQKRAALAAREVGRLRGDGQPEEDPNPTGETCGESTRTMGPCNRGLGHPGDHSDAAGNEWSADTEREHEPAEESA